MIFQVLASLADGVVLFLTILSWLIVINSLLSFFMDSRHRVRVLLRRFTDPIVQPFRKLTRNFGSSRMPIDISPMLALIVVWVVSGLFTRLSIYLTHLSYLR